MLPRSLFSVPSFYPSIRRSFSTTIGIDYYHYKSILKRDFIDSHGMVVNRSTNAHPNLPLNTAMGEGDAPWRTGLYAIALAMEGESALDELEQVMSALGRCWLDESNPIRHPNPQATDALKPYTKDQFIPQMAAAFTSWKLGMHLGNTPKGRRAQRIGQELLQKFVNVLNHTHRHGRFTFGPNSDSTAGHLRGYQEWIVSKIGKKMGLKNIWEHNEPTVNKRFMFEMLFQMGINNKRAESDNASEYYAIHLMFWMLDCLWIVHPTPLPHFPVPGRKLPPFGKPIQVNASDLMDEMAEANRKHRNGLFFWRGNMKSEARKLSQEWNPDFDKVDYFFQRNLHDQKEQMSMENPIRRIAPLAPMLLYRFINYPHYLLPPSNENSDESLLSADELSFKR